MSSYFYHLRFWFFSLVASLSLHGLFFLKLPSFYEPPQNGLASGASSVEVALIEAARDEKNTPIKVEEAKQEEVSVAAERVSEEKKVSTKKHLPQTGALSTSRTVVQPNTSGTPGSPDVVPSYLRNPQPFYPESERAAGHEGIVLLQVAVDATGKVTRVTLQKSSGYPALDRSALETVRGSWSFRPATCNRIPVAAEILIPIHFSLQKK